MRPVLISFGFLQFHSYTVMMAVAFLVGVLLAVRENYKRAEPYPITPAGGVWVYFGALFGARLYYILQYEGWREAYRAVLFWEGGLVYYGGLFGGFLGAVLYLRFKRVPILPVADIVMPYLPLSHAIARVGCFLNGCCWGVPTDMPWGMRYPRSVWGAYAQQVNDGLIDGSGAHSLPVHPTQLYCSLGLLVIFVVMRWAYRHKRHDGAVMLLYPLLYGVLRFVVEIFRGDSTRPLWNMTVSQVVAVLLILGAGAGFCLMSRLYWRATETGVDIEEMDKS